MKTYTVTEKLGKDLIFGDFVWDDEVMEWVIMCENTEIPKKHLHRYCDEYAYRYNTRKIADTERFVNVMVHTEGRLTYKNLIAK